MLKIINICVEFVKTLSDRCEIYICSLFMLEWKCSAACPRWIPSASIVSLKR